MLFRLSKTAWALFFALLSMFALGLSDNARGPLFPELLRYFNLSNSQGSLSFAVASFATLLGTAAGAVLLKRIRLDQLLGLAMLLMAVGLWALGVAPDYPVYLVSAVIFGLSMGTTGVAQNLLITESFKPPRQTRALSGLHAMYGFSSLLAPLVASRAPGWFEGHSELFSRWQSAFFLAGIMAAGVFILILLSRSEEPYVHHAPPPEADFRLRKSLVTMLWFAGFFASYVGAEILVSTRLALYMRTYFNAGLEASSNYVTYFFVFLLAGRLVFALKSFSVKLKTQLNLSLSLSLVLFVLGIGVHPFFLALTGLSMAPFYPLSIVYISEKTGFQKRRFLTFVIGVQSLFVILMHVGVGYMTDAYGLVYAFGLGIVLLVGSLICLNLHPEIVT